MTISDFRKTIRSNVLDFFFALSASSRTECRSSSAVTAAVHASNNALYCRNDVTMTSWRHIDVRMAPLQSHVPSVKSGMQEGWSARYYVLFNNISIVSRHSKGDNEKFPVHG